MEPVFSVVILRHSDLNDLIESLESYIINGFSVDGRVKLDIGNDEWVVPVKRVDFID